MNMIKCACGCNKELEEYDKYNRIRRFISGHQFFNENIKLKRILNAGRIPWTSEELYFLKENYRTLNNSEIGLKLGRKSVFVYSKMKQLKLFRSKELALELKRRSYSGEKNHNFNKKLNLSSRLKMSYKRRWNFVLGILDYTGYNNPSFGYRWNESQKRRQSVQMKDILKNNETIMKKHSQDLKLMWADKNSIYNNLEFRKRKSEATIKGIMKRPTSYEKKIADLCIEYSLPFIYTGNGTFLIGCKNPDFINKDNKIAIEIYCDYFKIRDYGTCENYEN